MSLYHIPSPYLSRLQDLKLWQGNYDALLQKNHEISKSTNCDTLNSLSSIDSSQATLTSKESRNNSEDEWDKKKISTPKPFDVLLEEKLAEDQPIVVDAKPKRPFLKKGTGLQRYKCTRNPVRTKRTRKALVNRDASTQNKANKDVISHITSFSPKKKLTITISDSQIEVTPLTMPEATIKPKATWCEVDQNFYHSEKNESKEKMAIFENIDEYNFKKMLPQQMTNHKFNPGAIKESVLQSNNIPTSRSIFENSDDRDLRIFEALEEKVEHNSFSSTNSSVLRLLSSTPNKAKLKLFQNCVKDMKRPASKNDSLDLGASPIENSRSPPQENAATSTYAARGTQSPELVEKALQCDEIEKKMEKLNVEQHVLKDFLDNLKKYIEDEKVKEAALSNGIDSSQNSSNSEKCWSSDSEERRSPGTSFYTDFENTLRTSEAKINIAINTSFQKDEVEQSILECENCKKLSKTVERLQKQIPDVQAEKAKVCDFAKELEKKRDQLHKELDVLKKKYDDDLRDLRRELCEEKKKSAKEKAIFEMYIKESQNRPSKKEREEISNLKKELADVKELMKLKETKNGATTARLRTQVKQLEKERDELKNNVEVLQKENAKLNASKKVNRPTEVKMLHQINKNLTKLTVEAFKLNNQSESGNTDTNVRFSAGSKKDCSPRETNKNSFRSKAKSSQVDDVEKCAGDRLTKEEVEWQYETIFGQFDGDSNSPSKNDDSVNISKKDRTETIFPDGSKEIKYGNGNVKTISPDGKLIIMQYYNGDIKETNKSDNTLKYFYSENSTWHTQFGDGSELIEYFNGQKEKKYADGKREITGPEGIFLTKFPDGTEEFIYPDKTKMIRKGDGEKIVLFANGQKEIHNKEHMRREYPDGTVKILHMDGTQETRYASGRVRIKDASGILIMDSDDR